MKTKILLFMMLPALLFVMGCEKEEPQESYFELGAKEYYLVGDNEKIYMYEIVGKFVIQLDTTQMFETALQKLKENPKIEYVETFIEEDYLVIVNSKLSLKKVKRQPAVINVMPAYTMDKHTPNYLTGELLLGLKKGCSIDDVRYVFEDKAVVKSEGGYDNYVLQVKNWDKIFYLNNVLYLLEEVAYCHPNMTAELVLH